ncbi:clasp N terminal-domain-containing protein [Protomyces lactucae-debilis]|uniref:Clasp N terminal-domain-containing protein n=1 Tax=Protomyces lactucae-debilis TaxID=2754530 RepID=A0A1Y2FVQ2_PROLT|nr:clasp N terminal-domain-containing protein [Protomyces lactucae-debilis]ORY86765.1 clasp N terminal-domain-containing protein [Protomyces lactucae-debilis]
MSYDAASELLGLMQNGLSHQQLEHLAAMKQCIKREIIETSAVRPLFQALTWGLPAANTQISSQSLTLAHGALRRLNLQDGSLLGPVLPLVLPLFINKLGDANEKVRDLARDCLAVAWKSCGAEVERAVKELGYRHQGWLVRRNSIQWTLKMSRDKPTGFVSRPFIGFLIACLEDGREEIRESAKDAIVELCEPLPPHARADLRRELYMQKVRKPMVDFILTALDIPDGPDLSTGRAVQPEEPRPKRSLQPSSHYEGSIAGSMASTFIGSVPGSELESVEPAYIASARDLEHDLQAMLLFFEGRESEKNWLNRERSIGKLRSLLRGNASKDHPVVLLANIKSLLDGIIKGMTSLRTSLCLASLQLVKDMCIILGPAVDNMVEQLLVTLVKLTGLTKKIAAQAANVTACVLLASVSYHARLLQQILQAAQDKNVAPRQYAAHWLKVLLEAHLEVKSQIEHSGMDIIDKILKKGLADANPAVRDAMRASYWSFAAVWPDRAATMMASLDPGTKKQLERAKPGSGVPDSVATQKPSDISRLLTHSRNASSTTARPAIHSMASHDRMAKAAAVPPITVSNSEPKTLPQVKEQRPSGLSSGPVRSGLGNAVRVNPSLAPPRKAVSKPDDALRSSTRSNSSATHTNGSSLTSHTSPSKRDPPPSAMKKKQVTIVEQLESENWRTRVDGVITLACLLANKEPPNSDGTKILLPSHETLAPILRKLMADQQAEVVDHLMAPEVIFEIAKIIDWDAILPRVLYMAETDDSDRGHDVQKDCLPAVKRMFNDYEAVQHCLETLAVLKVSGHSVKMAKPNFRFTPVQKRPIIKAVLLWLTEAIERHLEAVEKGEPGNQAFSEPIEYKLVMNRIMSMMTNVQPTSMNYGPLAACLKALRKADEATFDKNLSTFERPVTNALKRAWGEKAVEEDVGVEEPVADVQQVLGSYPLLVADTVEKRSVSGGTVTDEPLTPEKATTTTDPAGFVAESPQFDRLHTDQLLPPKTPANFRNAVALLEDSPISTNGNASTSVSPVQDKSRKKFHGQDRWYRSQMRQHVSGTPLPAGYQAKKYLLAELIGKLPGGALDVSEFRKFGKLVKEEVDQNNTDGTGLTPDLWDAGSSFDVLIKSIIAALQSDSLEAHYKTQTITLLRSLLRAQPRYFSGHEDETVVALLSLASNAVTNRILAAGVEEALIEITDDVEAVAGTETVLQFLFSYIERDEAAWHATRIPSLQVSLVCLSRLIAQLTRDTFAVFAKATAKLVTKAFSDKFEAPDVEVAEIRRRTVNVCLSIHTVVGDTRQTLALLHALKPSHQNLLTYYFANKERDGYQV